MVPPPSERSASESAGKKGERFKTSAAIRQVSEVLRLMSNPDRLKLLLILANGDRAVSDLLTDFPGQTEQFISRHLRLLRRGRLVDDRPVKTFRVYSLTDLGRNLIRAIGKSGLE